MWANRRNVKGVRTAVVVALLAFTAGSLDGSLFSLYDMAFASIMTGNMILVGVSASNMNILQVIILILSIGGYCIGVFTGARVVRKDRELFYLRDWPFSVIMCLCISLLVLCVASSVAIIGHESTVLLGFQFMLFSSSMGIMAATVKKVGFNVSVTYLTGAITIVWERLAGKLSLSETGITAPVSILALIAGALTGGFISTYVGAEALFVPAITMLATICLLISNLVYGTVSKSNRKA